MDCFLFGVDYSELCRLDKSELEKYLHEEIPLSKAMAVSVTHASADRVELSAPLGPNINHRDTVFSSSCVCSRPCVRQGRKASA